MKPILLFVLFIYCTDAFSQLSAEINIYPFSNSSREDSLEVATKRVTALLEARLFFEKTYLRKKLVFLPFRFSNNQLSDSGPFYLYSEIAQMSLSNNNRTIYKRANRQLKKAIRVENKKRREINRSLKEEGGNSTLSQTGLIALAKKNDYVFLFCAEQVFTERDETDPRANDIIDSLRLKAEQIYLGKPHNIEGYITSINYNAFNFDNLKMPTLITALLQENLRLNKVIVNDTRFSNKLDNISIDYNNLNVSNKLWIYTDEAQKIIYLSPYLIRAVFNICLYKVKLFKLAEEVTQRGGSLQEYFRGKSASSVSEIDNAYFDKFVDEFSRNFFFLIGHELAHIYLNGESVNCDIEMACDSYSAYFDLAHFNELDPGIFETLLIKSIESNELNFWGDAINKNDLEKRYRNLLALKASKNQETNACPLNVK